MPQETLNQDQAQRDLRPKLIFLLSFSALFFVCLLGKPVRHSLMAAGDLLCVSFAAGIGAYWSLAAVPKRSYRGLVLEIVSAPFLIGAGLLSWLFASGFEAYFQVALHHMPPFPSLADAAYLMAYPFLLAGVLRLPHRPLPLVLRGRVLLDSLMIMTALVTFSWYFILGPTILQGADTFLGKIVGIAYPLGDLLLLACLILLSAQGGSSKQRGTIIALSIGLVSTVLGDALYDITTLNGTYTPGTLTDASIPLSFFLIGWAARSARLALLQIKHRMTLAIKTLRQTLCLYGARCCRMRFCLLSAHSYSMFAIHTEMMPWSQEYILERDYYCPWFCFAKFLRSAKIDC